ncbi:MAG: alpha/beta hydrolase [Flavobacteriaceae bacterium]|nr:alpha/beta hydrolase [Flavobacteriaceae bacterium]|tara:strand:+ start:311 stop:1087 length:777 start_codon:yes stop_codon:yes gene_type:complete
MEIKHIEKSGYKYLTAGKGNPIVILHGLMGGLGNFESFISHFPRAGFQVFMPELPIYTASILDTNVKFFANYINKFINQMGLKHVILVGNSLGGHVALLHSKLFPKATKALVLTGSSGLYENSMGDTYPKRGDYEFIKKKTQNVFYSPKIATKEIVDEVFESVNNRNKVIKILAMAKSAIRHNMSKDLPKINIPVALVWGKNDSVTPPKVAREFHQLLPDSSLFWIDKCGHAPMMEHPKKFNNIVENWFVKNNFKFEN